MSDVRWFRVIDPLSPLYGCDVRGFKKPVGNSAMTVQDFLVIEAMRRVDIFVGDRPFQLVAPSGECLGLLIDWTQLEPSPIQDEIVELSTDLPYGEFLEEVLDEREGLQLHCVAYERAYQVALLGTDPPSVIVSRTLQNSDDEVVRIRAAFDRGDDVDDIKYMIERAA